uniref:Uncharacterized protein n=1 Tax=viral metagenome TaxID=1070528 RepID=A0A6C0JL81_9ZZZZ
MAALKPRVPNFGDKPFAEKTAEELAEEGKSSGPSSRSSSKGRQPEDVRITIKPDPSDEGNELLAKTLKRAKIFSAGRKKRKANKRTRKMRRKH